VTSDAKIVSRITARVAMLTGPRASAEGVSAKRFHLSPLRGMKECAVAPCQGEALPTGIEWAL
jgi:hypothetical protein